MDIRQFLKRKNDDEKKGSQEKKDEGENEDEHVSSKHASQSEESAPEQSASTGPAEPPPSKKPKKKTKGRGFREEWKVGRPWLKYDSSKGLMYCEICCGQNIQTKRGKLKGSVFVKGCSNMKQEAVEDHEKAWPVIFPFVG